MAIKNKIVKDTMLLTAMQLALDTASLFMNVFITRKLGSSAMGILALTGSFLMLVGIISNGNAFLCTSRLVSEEIGKKNGNPNKVLRYALLLCTALSVGTGLILLAFSDFLSFRFFKSPLMSNPIKLMAISLPIGAYSSCFKGFFNATRKVSETAKADIIEFIVRTVLIVFCVSTMQNLTDSGVCGIMVLGLIAGNLTSLIFFIIKFFNNKHIYADKPTITMRKYISFALPIMGGGILQTILSSTNDALIPVTLRQFGNSVSEAFSQFGIFEAIVIPTLFFPSVILCALSGIVITVTARYAAANDIQSIRRISKKLIEGALLFSVIVAAVLMRFGNEIGLMLDGGELAGRMIAIIAPVIPFIYMEIVLEALIKGMGKQKFSSLNYLVEYAVRISAILILVPHIGFYGIVVSYYASNIIGNTSRVIMIMRNIKPNINIVKSIIVPIIYVYLTLKASELLVRITYLNGTNLAHLIIFTAIWAGGYYFMTTGWRCKNIRE